MWTRVFASYLALGAFAGAAFAEEAPLSAIDWLSRSLEAPVAPAAPADALPETVTVERIAAPPRAIGSIAPTDAGLAATLWTGSDSGVLVDLLHRMPTDMPLELRDTVEALVSVKAPADDPEQAFLLARIDTLLALGRLDAARRLIDAAGEPTPPLFRRSFDISLLTGHEDAGCDALEAHPDMAPTYPVRIFCLARRGDWPAAVLTLDSVEALGVLTPADVAILARFLHDGEEDMLPPPERPGTVTPLTFRLYEGIGEPLATRQLPLAFAHSDLRPQNGWKTRLEAAERLYRAGAIDGASLLALYAERAPAASGGVWDRVAAVQAWQAADPADKAATAAAAAEAAKVLSEAGLGRLLGPDSAPAHATPIGPGAAPDADLAAMIAEGRAGEAALMAILRAAAAWEGIPDDLSRALAALAAVGFDGVAGDNAPQWAATR